jgi:hypothetical protein
MEAGEEPVVREVPLINDDVLYRPPVFTVKSVKTVDVFLQLPEIDVDTFPASESPKVIARKYLFIKSVNAARYPGEGMVH